MSGLLNATAPASAPSTSFASAPTLTRLAWLSSLVVLGLGYAREIAAAAAGIPSNDYGLQDLRLDAETSLGSWYSSSLMLLSALAMLLAARCDCSPAGRATRTHWGVLGIIFLLLSADESMGLHEQLMPLAHALLDIGGYFYFGWVVVGLAVAALVALAYLPFLCRVGRRTAAGLLAAGAIYLAGALGFEMLGGYAYERFGPTPYYVVTTVLEESFEIAGLILLFGVVVAHAAAVLPPLRTGRGRRLPRRPGAA